MPDQRRFDIAHYADMDLPGYREPAPPHTPTGDTSGWSLVVVTANVLLALILIVGMAWDGRSVLASILTGAGYYAVTTLGVIALSSGQAGAMWRAWLESGTERHRIDAYEYLHERKLELDAAPPTLPAAPVQPPQAPSGALTAYVPAYPPEAVSEAWAWVLGLYRDGQLDPRRVRSGYVQGAVVGSKRGGGSAEALALLRAHKFLKRAEGGYIYNARRYPTVGHAQAVFAELHDGVGG